MSSVINERISPEKERRYIAILEELLKVFNIPLTRTQLGILLEYMQVTEPLALEEYMLLINSYRLLYKLDCESRLPEPEDINKLLQDTAIHAHPKAPHMARFTEKKDIILKIFLQQY